MCRGKSTADHLVKEVDFATLNDILNKQKL